MHPTNSGTGKCVGGGRDFSFGDAVLCYILNIGVTVKHGIKCELSLELTHWLLSAGPHRCRKSAGSLSLLDHSACQQPPKYEI